MTISAAYNTFPFVQSNILGEHDGQRRFLSEAPSHLAEGGRLVLSFGDTGEFQAFCDMAAASDLAVTLIAEGEERLDGLFSLKICELRPVR